MRAIRIQEGFGLDHLALGEREEPAPVETMLLSREGLVKVPEHLSGAHAVHPDIQS